MQALGRRCRFRIHVRARPAPRYMTTGYHEEDFEIWDSGGMLVAQSRQLALPAASDPPS
jgi:hypothetical protein